jgi:hypothetical protein
MNESSHIVYKEKIILCPHCQKEIDAREVDVILKAQREMVLQAEIMTWRWFIAFLTIVFIMVSIGGFIFSEKFRSNDNSARAKHWERLEIGQTRIIAMIDKNYQMLRNNDEQLDKCASCHTHDKAHK